jgi:iron complex outermembrane receptor protein
MRSATVPFLFAFALALSGWAALGPVPVSAQDGRLEGTVTAADDGAPVPRANVVLRRDGEQWGTSTDSSGAFAVEAPAGTYRLTVSALGYEPQARSVTIPGGGTRAVTIELPGRRYALNEILVEDRSGRAAGAPSTVQRISAQALERQDAADVSELAVLAPATHVQTNSRGQTILYFRNAGDRQVGQFFDGALLNIPWDNRVDISLIPASVVEEVTVTKGVPSVRYGANVLGGAINFQSRTRDAPGQTTEVAAALGTAEQRRASLTHVGRQGAWDYTAAVQYAGRGDQPLPEGADLEYNQPRSDRRVNTDRQLVSAFGRVGYRFDNGGQMGVSLLHVDAEQGVAPEGNATVAQTRYWRYPLWQKTTLITSGQTPVGTNTSIRGAVWGSRFAQDIADYRSVAYDTLNQVQQGRDRTAGMRLIGTRTLPAGTLTLALNGLTSQHEKGTIPAGQAGGDPDSTTLFQQHIFSAGLEYEAPLHPRVDLSVGASLDGAATPKTGPFPERDPFYAWGLTTGLRVDVADGWALRGAAGRKSRFPTMRELFGAALGKFVPNPALKPVTAWIGEVGVERRTETLYLGTTAFLNRVYDTIDKRTFQQGPNAGKEQRVNLRGARIYGVETTARWTPVDALTVDGSVTWSRPRSFTDEGTRKLDEKPGVLGTGTVTYTLPVGISVMGQARYTGQVYARNEQNAFVTLPSSPSTVLDARLSYALSALTDRVDGRLYVRGENLTDETVFIGLGLPRPGRSFRVGLSLTL